MNVGTSQIPCSPPTLKAKIQAHSGVVLSDADMESDGLGNDNLCTIHSISWSSNGQYVLGCSLDNDSSGEHSMIFCWEIPSETEMESTIPRLVATISHHEGSVGTAKFVPQCSDKGPKKYSKFVDCSSLEAMKNLALFVSVGETDCKMLLCEAEGGTNLAEFIDIGPFGDIQIVPANISLSGDTNEEIVYKGGNILYVNSETCLKMCTIELCRVSKKAMNIIHCENGMHNENTEPSYYYRLTSVCAIDFPHVIVSISSICAFNLSSSFCVLSFADNHGCALVHIESKKLEVVQEYCLNHRSESRQERYILRAAIGSEYFNSDIDIHSVQASALTSSQGPCLVASGRENGTIGLWRRDHCEQIATLTGHTGCVNDVCWVPHASRLLISVSDDRTIRFWR